MTGPRRADEAYDRMLSLTDELAEPAALLRLLGDVQSGHVTATHLIRRWRREHVLTPTGEVEARLVPLPGGAVEVRARYGAPRRFTDRATALAWVTAGGQYCTGEDSGGCTHPPQGPHVVRIQVAGRAAR